MQKIYFGDVIVKDTRNGATTTISKIIFLESDTPPATRLRAYILRYIATKERDKYQIIRFCTESAKVTGITAY